MKIFDIDEAKTVLYGTNGSDGKVSVKSIKTTQIRKILSAVNIVNNKVLACEVGEEKFNELMPEIQYLKVKFLYQAGRFPDVKKLITEAKIIQRIDAIKTKEDYKDFAKFIEALVAYHKFAGGN